MATLEYLLDDMRQRITKADFAGIAALAPALEAAIEGHALADGAIGRDRAALQRIKAKAEENAAFLDAARRGVRAARRRVEDARRAALGLQTYDVKGQRSDISPLGPTAGRF